MYRIFKDPREARAKMAYSLATATGSIQVNDGVDVQLTPFETLRKLLQDAEMRGVEILRLERNQHLAADQVQFIGTALSPFEMLPFDDTGYIPACISTMVAFHNGATDKGGMNGVPFILSTPPLSLSSTVIIETDDPTAILETIDSTASVIVISHVPPSSNRHPQVVAYYEPGGCVDNIWTPIPVLGTTILTEGGVLLNGHCFSGDDCLSYTRHIFALFYLDNSRSEKSVPSLEELGSLLASSPRLKLMP